MSSRTVRGAMCIRRSLPRLYIAGSLAISRKLYDVSITCSCNCTVENSDLFMWAYSALMPPLASHPGPMLYNSLPYIHFSIGYTILIGEGCQQGPVLYNSLSSIPLSAGYTKFWWGRGRGYLLFAGSYNCLQLVYNYRPAMQRWVWLWIGLHVRHWWQSPAIQCWTGNKRSDIHTKITPHHAINSRHNVIHQHNKYVIHM